MKENIYISLDEAREELARRWKDEELKKRIEDELGEKFWDEFRSRPRGLVWNCVASPDNGLIFAYQCSKYMNVEPLAFEFLGDMYLSLNEMKKNLGKLHVQLDNNEKATINIIDLHKWNKRKISEITTKTGELLHDFHHELIEVSGYKIEVKDKTSWVRNIGAPAEWYYYYLLHFVAHGVLFEAYLSDNDARDDNFFQEIVSPALIRIKDKFGLKPIIIKLYPENQSEAEDFYWWCFPPNINRYIINYANKNKLTFKEITVTDKLI